MLFNSFIFLIFAALFFHIWPIVYNKKNTKWIALTVASFIFYGWWDWRFLFLIAFSGLIDFYAGMGIRKYPKRKKLLLILSIAGNVGSLMVFKYLTFLLTNLHNVAESLSSGFSIPIVQLTLPIGISFYTFQSMSYTIDIYRGKMEPTTNVFHYFAYLSLFPQLVAGPIIRAAHLMPQMEETRRPTDTQIWEGIKLIAYGYFKKVVIADQLAQVINLAFANNTPTPSAPYWWLITTLFAIQIYCDFSGYSDIARGLAKWMGFEFPLNFNHPYIAKGIRDFWSRWHISLTTWFRDYVFLPLGGAWKGRPSGLMNLWITFLLSGLWHGAAWNFVIWGGLHALYLTVEELTKWPRKLRRKPGGKIIATLFVIVQVWIGWVFFRAESLGQALDILKIMFNINMLSFVIVPKFNFMIQSIVLIAIAREFLYYFGVDGKFEKKEKVYPILETVLVGLAVLAIIFFRGPGSAFIYFQF
jgi:alginate O-acetyltransferase complex protein AlgI